MSYSHSKLNVHFICIVNRFCGCIRQHYVLRLFTYAHLALCHLKCSLLINERLQITIMAISTLKMSLHISLCISLIFFCQHTGVINNPSYKWASGKEDDPGVFLFQATTQRKHRTGTKCRKLKRRVESTVTPVCCSTFCPFCCFKKILNILQDLSCRLSLFDKGKILPSLYSFLNLFQARCPGPPEKSIYRALQSTSSLETLYPFKIQRGTSPRGITQTFHF